MTETVYQLPMLSTRAALQPQTYRDDTRTVELTWTTGATVRRFDFMDGPYLEELSVTPESVRMDRLNGGAPLLANHNAYSLDAVIGVVERAWIEGGEGRATVRFSERADVDPIIADVKAGILRNISVGYQVHNYEVDKPKERGGMPTYRATDWEPMELSIVTVPADASAQIRSAEALYPVSLTTRGDTMSELDNEVAADEDQASPVVEESAKPALDAEAIAKRAIAEERQRIAGIRAIVKLAKLDESVAESLIESGKPLDECRADVLRLWSESVDRNATPSGRPDYESRSDDQKRAASIAADLLKQVAGA